MRLPLGNQRRILGNWRRKILLLLVLGIALGYIYQNPAILSYDYVKNTVTPLLDKAQIQLGLDANSMTTVYSSRDENGVIEFSDNAPMDNPNATSIKIDSNVNLMPATLPRNNKAAATKTLSAEDSLTGITPTTPYTEPQKIIKLLNDANNLQGVLNDRKAKLDRHLDEM